MTNNRSNWTDYIRRLPNWVIGIISLITAIVGIITLWQGNEALVVIALLIIGTVGALLGCVYLAFKRTPPLILGGKGVWQYPRWRTWALAGLILIPTFTIVGISYSYYTQSLSPTKTIILVANFDGPEPNKYRVTETILTQLRHALQPYNDIQVTALDEIISPTAGRNEVRALAEDYGATIVIWGWYGVTKETTPININFELLPHDLRELEPKANGLVQVLPVTDLESFTLQTQLSANMTYFSLFTVGMIRFAVKDWDGAISLFENAQLQTTESISEVSQSKLHFMHGTAHLFKDIYTNIPSSNNNTWVL